MIKQMPLMVLIVLFAVNLVAAQEEACTGIGGVWNAETERCDRHISFEIDIQYPLEYADYPNAQKTVDDFIQQSYQSFMQNVTDAGYIPFHTAYPWTLMIHYEIVRHSDTVSSIVFTTHDYAGGAHGNTYFKTFTFDLEADTLIALDDLFQPDSQPLAVLSPIVQDALVAQMGTDPDLNWIAEGTGEKPENYRNFALTEDSLMFYFDPYQVAPYAGGPQTVAIPLADIADILAEPFAPSPD